MSEMSQSSAPPGGDPMDLTGEVGTEDDVLPGPPGGVDVGEVPGEVPPGAGSDSGPVSEAVPGPPPDEILNPPGRQMDVDPDASADPIDQADTEAMRPPGVGGSESGSDPMPDMTGTTE
jgi:hypothetical protein